MSFWCNCLWKLFKFALSTFRKCQIEFCNAPILDKNLSSSLFLKICIATLCLRTGGGQKEITYIFIFCLCVVSTKSWLLHLSFFAQKKICRLENFKTNFMKRIVFLDQFEEGSNFHSTEAGLLLFFSSKNISYRLR